jgi:hypothetical protein
MREALTAEQLDALPEGARVVDRYGDVFTKRDRLWHSYETAVMWSAKVAKWRPRLATPEEVAAKQAALAAFERSKRQHHTQECMNRTRIGVPALDRCNCPVDSQKESR